MIIIRKVSEMDIGSTFWMTKSISDNIWNWGKEKKIKQEARDEILDEAIKVLDVVYEDYKKLDKYHRYLDGIDISIQRLEELRDKGK
jgi:hypothetical protein